jgi:hypothetical protein
MAPSHGSPLRRAFFSLEFPPAESDAPTWIPISVAKLPILPSNERRPCVVFAKQALFIFADEEVFTIVVASLCQLRALSEVYRLASRDTSGFKYGGRLAAETNQSRSDLLRSRPFLSVFFSFSFLARIKLNVTTLAFRYFCTRDVERRLGKANAG